MTIVFLMPFARRLDLAGARHGTRLAAKLLLRGAADHIEALRQLAFEPVVKRRIRFDGQLARQRIAMQFGDVTSRRWPHPKINEPSLRDASCRPTR